MPREAPSAEASPADDAATNDQASPLQPPLRSTFLEGVAPLPEPPGVVARAGVAARVSKALGIVLGRLDLRDRSSALLQRLRSVPSSRLFHRFAQAEQRPKVLGTLALLSVALVAVVLTVFGLASRGTAARNTAVASATQAPAPSERVLADTFDAVPTGSDPGWEMNRARPDLGTVAIAPLPTSVDRSVRLTTLAASDQAFTACRTLPPVQSGVLVVQAVVLVDGFGRGATTIASVGAGAIEVTRLRVGPGGEIQLTNEAGRGGTGPMAANAWYDVTFDIDTATQTYGLTVASHGTSTQLSKQDQLRWIGQLGGGLDRVCFAPPAGVAGRSLYVSDLRITAR